MFNNNFFFLENHAVYGKAWKNIVQPDRPQITEWRMRTAYWIPKATNTFRICNTYRFYSAAMAARMLCYTYTACLVNTQNQCRLCITNN